MPATARHERHGAQRHLPPRAATSSVKGTTRQPDEDRPVFSRMPRAKLRLFPGGREVRVDPLIEWRVKRP